MQIGLRQFSPKTVDWFKDACAGGRSRTSIARELCEREHWNTFEGKPNLGSARKVLGRLADHAGVSLPSAQAPPGDGRQRPSDDYPDHAVACSLAAVVTVKLAPFSHRDGLRWAAMMQSHHPEGWRRAPGGQMRYWITSSGHGVLGRIPDPNQKFDRFTIWPMMGQRKCISSEKERR